MRRAVAVFANDVRLQIRYGLYGVSLVMVLIWGVLLGVLARGTDLTPAVLIAPFIALNMIITTFYFMAALLLFEKGEGVLPAIVTTPLTATGYLISKCVSLSLLATAETLLIVAFVFGARFVSPRLVVAAFALGVFYALCGFLTVVRFDSINQFLLPSVPVVMLLVVPLAGGFGIVAIAIASLLALWLARREFQRYVVRA